MTNKIKTLTGICPSNIPFDDLFATNKPILLKGLVRDWPLVKLSSEHNDIDAQEAVIESLLKHDSHQPFVVYKGKHSIDAKFSYNETCTGFNFDSVRSNFKQVIERICSQLSQDEHDYLYVNSLRLDQGFPSLSSSHSLNFDHSEFTNNQPVAKIWLGTESVAAGHFDIPRNIACCVFGKRRFTLFEPKHVDNLYPGPLSPTPGGQVVTMADLNKPNLNAYPKLDRALKDAYVVDMEPGDALYYPSMWWHQVQAMDRFNVMINFWWMTAPAYMGNPMDVLSHAMLSLRDRPSDEKKAWKALFDYYVFGDTENVTQHLPPACHGALAPIDEVSARRLRAMLLNNLNR